MQGLIKDRGSTALPGRLKTIPSGIAVEGCTGRWIGIKQVQVMIGPGNRLRRLAMYCGHPVQREEMGVKAPDQIGYGSVVATYHAFIRGID